LNDEVLRLLAFFSSLLSSSLLSSSLSSLHSDVASARQQRRITMLRYAHACRYRERRVSVAHMSNMVQHICCACAVL